MALRVRELTAEEADEVRRRVHSRTTPARVVDRARIIWCLHQGERVPAVARAVGVSEKTVRLWLKRFNEYGLDGLRDDPRSGRPPTYPAEAIGAVSATAMTASQSLGLPFASWTSADSSGKPAARNTIAVVGLTLCQLDPGPLDQLSKAKPRWNLHESARPPGHRGGERSRHALRPGHRP